ncbi:DNA primase [Leadbettera azotonutricia]|uniref:DNA primase n=1 Tax=Leadbettera azotonutricia (strain ATCC BAA-888 / DSM 13862 / ZAS-9) TaxID=545695 RepID=F5YC88_LEAAZ|nr:DNA primase [Leadbettera azotonutricia]AEF82243.1 DNA primase [Leadbettera azotonutricia ZAS-9]
MPLISKTTIDEVNSRMDAVAVVQDYVRLDKRGGRWWGLCPFHSEKTGSFTVNPEMKAYHCFGCGKGGSVLNFVMEMDKLSFPETVELLAKKLGIEIVYDNSGSGPAPDDGKNQRKEELFELYRRMAATFQHFLEKKAEGGPAKQYIIGRGLNNEMIERFHLGYAPGDRQWLYSFLLKKGYSRDFLNVSGLFSSRYPGMPLFAGRIMFPISDRQGRIVAFGGRVLEGAQGPVRADGRAPPKYINSPEIEIYKKGETIFAIDLALPEIRHTKEVYLVEGYMDAIAMHQAGIANTVAPLGTAFTDDQAKLLRRWAEKAILVFDSDGAGQAAVVKGILTCRRNGLSCAVAVPTGEGEAALKDPADILKNYGPEALQKSVKCYINDFEYLIARAKSLYDTSGSEGKAKAVSFIFPFIQTLDSEVAKDAFIDAAADAFGASRQAVKNDLRRIAAGIRQGEGKPQPHKEDKPGQVRMNDELFLLMVVAVNDMKEGNQKLYPEFRKALKINEIDDAAAKELFIALEESYINDEAGVDQFLDRIKLKEVRDFFLERGSSEEFTINPERLLADGIKKTIRKKLERQLDEIVIKLRSLKKNASPGDEEADDLLAEKMRIDEKLRQLKEDSR